MLPSYCGVNDVFDAPHGPPVERDCAAWCGAGQGMREMRASRGILISETGNMLEARLLSDARNRSS